MDFMKKINFLEFMIIGSEQTYEKQIGLFQHEVDSLETVLNHRTDETNWMTKHFEYKDFCIVGKNCETSSWSSKSPDLSIEGDWS